MSAINPVDTKAGESKPAPEQAAALAPAVAATAKKGMWAALGAKQKLGVLVGGTVLVVAGGMLAVNQFRTTPPPPAAVAQADPAPAAQPAPAPEPPKGRFESIGVEIPDVTVIAPAVKPVKHEDPELAAPGIKPPDGDPPITIRGPGGQKNPDPPTPGGKPYDPTKKADDDKWDGPVISGETKDDPTKTGDDFKAPLGPAPAPLPASVTERKDKAGQPVIRIGAQDKSDVTPPGAAKKDDIPKIDLDIPALPPTPRLDGTPSKPDPAKGTKDPDVKDEGLPVVAPPTVRPADPPTPVNPMTEKPAGKDPELPPVKLPGVDVPPPPVVDVPTPGLKPPGLPVPEKKDSYDEDWHTPKSGDTYALISKEYYKTADYASALEAYNKDRRRAGEAIIRVPPPWVLEEKFPGLVKKPDDKPAADPKPGGSNFDPVEPGRGGSRPAPPPSVAPAGGSNDEYRVTAEAGETIREIARKMYGDPNAWKRIWDANSGIDPTQPIPAGTTLRLPK
jgi:phage tail protein X